MVDFTHKVALPLSAHFPLDDALEPLKKQPFITLGADASIVQRTWAAFSGDKNRLDLGDVFHALAHPSLYGDVADISSRLLEILGYTEDGPLQFKTVALGPQQQLALTIIEPESRDLAEPTLVFAAGFAHPASLYTPSMQAMAKSLRTKVVIVDHPGSGGSQTSHTISQKDLYKALTIAITSEVPDGGKYYVGGHSMGSSPAYRLLKDINAGKSPVGNRELVRMMVINPIPTRLQEVSGSAAISRRFILGGVLSQVAHGFQGITANSLHLFNNETDSTITDTTTPIVEREDIPMSTLGMVTLFAEQDLNDPTPRIGSDKRLAIILSKKDHLMNWNTDAYTHRRGYHIIDGDHGACLIGSRISSLCTQHMVSALHGEPDNTVPLATTGSVYRHSGGTIRLGMGWRSDNSAIISPEISVRQGVVTLGGAAGVYLGSGITADVGYKFGDTHHVVANPNARLYLGAEGLTLPIDLKFGVRGGVDFAAIDRPITYGLVTSIGTNLVRAIDLEVQGRFTLSGQFQDIIAGLAIRFL